MQIPNAWFNWLNLFTKILEIVKKYTNNNIK